MLDVLRRDRTILQQSKYRHSVLRLEKVWMVNLQTSPPVAEWNRILGMGNAQDIRELRELTAVVLKGECGPDALS